MQIKAKLRYKILAKLMLLNGRWLTEKMFAVTSPYTDIGDYMSRWWFIKHPDKKGEPDYGTLRNKFREFYPFYARFHHIKREDEGRDHHDHPFDFTSIIVRGWYREERLVNGKPQQFTHNEGSTVSCTTGQFHRIIEVSPGGVLTFVIHNRRKSHSWGFMVNGRWIHHEEYIKFRMINNEYQRQMRVFVHDNSKMELDMLIRRFDVDTFDELTLNQKEKLMRELKIYRSNTPYKINY